MKKVLLIILISQPFILWAQHESVKFERLKFSEAMQRAKEENKYIFLDAYTSWCVPCKRMEKEVFSRERVAQYLNASFVNVKFDMEKGEGIGLRERYGVSAFPTYLIIKPDGELLHKMIGYSPADSFLAGINKGLSNEYSSERLKKRFIAGERSPSFIELYKKVLNETYDRAGLLWLCTQLFEGQTDAERFDSANWAVYKSSIRSSSQTVFRYMLYHQDRVSNYVPKDELTNKLKVVCFVELFDHFTGKKKIQEATLENLMNDIRFIPVGFDDDVNVVARAILLRDAKRYDELLTLYEQSVSKLTINRLFWDRYLAEMKTITPEQYDRIREYLIISKKNCHPNSEKFYTELLDWFSHQNTESFKYQGHE